MNVAILFFFSALAALGGKIFAKLCSNHVVGSSVAKYTLFLSVNGAVACLFFWISGGFRLALNLTTLFYSAVYALIITVILISGLMVYRFATIAGVNILSSAFGLVGSLVMGALLFDESIGARHLIRVGIMLVAVLLVFLDARRHESKEERRPPRARVHTVKKIAVLAAMLLSGLANTAITKAFAVSKSVTDENSFFFFTNALIVLGAAVIFLIVCGKMPCQFRESVKLLHPKQLVSLAGNTVCSNVGSLIGLRIMVLLPVSVYSPISSAVGIFLSLISSWIFRERLGLYSYLAAAVACVAIIL